MPARDARARAGAPIGAHGCGSSAGALPAEREVPCTGEGWVPGKTMLFPHGPFHQGDMHTAHNSCPSTQANNCIAFADFMAGVLTGGTVRGLPLIFDALAGSFPAVDPPLLPMMIAMVGLPSWHVLTDGGRLRDRFTAAHPALCCGGSAMPGAAPVEPAVPAMVEAAPTGVDSAGGDGASECEDPTLGQRPSVEVAIAATAGEPAVLPADSCRSAETTAPMALGSTSTSSAHVPRRSLRIAATASSASAPRGLAALPPRRVPRSNSCSTRREEGSSMPCE